MFGAAEFAVPANNKAAAHCKILRLNIATALSRLAFFGLNDLVQPSLASDCVDELLRVVTNALLEDDFDLLDIAHVSGRIAVEQHEVGLLSRSDRPDLICTAEVS